MAFNVAGLSNYTKEESLQLLTKAMFSSKTATLLQGAGQVLPGIKSAEILPLLSSDVFFQADSCSYQSSGTTTISQRTLTVGKVKVQETLCPKDLETKYTQKALAAGEAIDLGVFTEQIGMEKAGDIAEAIETAIWQGDLLSANGNLNKWDGFLTILDSLGFGGAGDPIRGNVGGAYSSITASNIDDIIGDGRQVGDFRLWTLQVPEGTDAKQLREIALTGVRKAGGGTPAAVLAAAVADGRVSLIAAVNQAGQDRGLFANDLLNSALPSVEGRGGGKKDAAQGGGTNPAGVPAAFEAANAFIRGLPG